MKKLIGLTVLVFFSSALLYAQKQAASKIPAPVKAAFNRAHPGIVPDWEKEDGSYEASFKQSGKSMSVVLDARGTILETETDITVSALPEAAKNYVKEHYKGVKIKEASRIEKAGGVVEYEALVQGTDLIFDKNGKFLKKSKEEKD